MANYTVTPNMSMNNPTPSVDPGPDYANNITAAINIIDSHTHLGDGLTGEQLTQASLNITGDLSIGTHNATNLRSTRFTSQGATLSAVGDVGCLYEVGNDLYYNDGAGNVIRITIGGVLDVGVQSNILYNPLSVVGNHIILSTDIYVYFAVSTASARTITLPAANAVTAGRFYIVKDVTGSGATNNITISAAGSDVIDGSASFAVSSNYGGAMLVSDGTSKWSIVSWNPNSAGDITFSTSSSTTQTQTVNKIQGIAISGTPSVGGTLVATSSSAAAWSSTIGANSVITTFAGGEDGYVNIIGDASYTVDSGLKDYIILSAATVSRTITLPTHSAGRVLIIKDTGGHLTSVINLVIARNGGSGTIEGVSSSYTIAAPSCDLTLISDGISNWSII